MPELAFILVAILVIWSVLARAAVFKLMHYPGGVNVLLDLLAHGHSLPVVRTTGARFSAECDALS